MSHDGLALDNENYCNIPLAIPGWTAIIEELLSGSKCMA
jgi:hypothetical protein